MTCLPRLRGDRPVMEEDCPRLLSSPPPTRGSTCTAAPSPPKSAVSPAYAGIDPHCCAPCCRWPRLPRLRGDRPEARKSLAATDRSPPPTRGSTFPGFPGRLSVRVSPAYAGIDLHHVVPLVAAVRLPRLRGDRPVHACGYYGWRQSPPPTRGSTRRKTAPI